MTTEVDSASSASGKRSHSKHSEQQQQQAKRQKTRPTGKRQWQVPRKGPPHGSDQTPASERDELAAHNIEPGDSGIWATCALGKEAKCVGELRDLFSEHADKLYGEQGAKDEEVEEEVSIEDSVRQEVEQLRNPRQAPWFTHIRVDVQCVLFFRSNYPATVDTTAVVLSICREALANAAATSLGAGSVIGRRTRFIKRLTPMARMCKASETSLLATADAVLSPQFPGLVAGPGAGLNLGSGSDSGREKTFAIRPTLRNHSKMLSRDAIIKSVAGWIAQRNRLVSRPGGPAGAGETGKQAESVEAGGTTGTTGAAENTENTETTEAAGSAQQVQENTKRLYRVDLQRPDVLVLVEVYRSICGVVALDAREWERCKRFNLSEIFSPTVHEPAPVPAPEAAAPDSEAAGASGPRGSDAAIDAAARDAATGSGSGSGVGAAANTGTGSGAGDV